MTDYVELRYTDDANNWQMPRLLPMGDTGDFNKPLEARRLGITRGRAWEIRYSGDRRFDLLAVEVMVE